MATIVANAYERNKTIGVGCSTCNWFNDDGKWPGTKWIPEFVYVSSQTRAFPNCPGRSRRDGRGAGARNRRRGQNLPPRVSPAPSRPSLHTLADTPEPDSVFPCVAMR